MNLCEAWILIDFKKFRKHHKLLMFQIMYGSINLLQKRIDEEGCGAVFCAGCLEE